MCVWFISAGSTETQSGLTLIRSERPRTTCAISGVKLRRPSKSCNPARIPVSHLSNALRIAVPGFTARLDDCLPAARLQTKKAWQWCQLFVRADDWQA